VGPAPTAAPRIARRAAHLTRAPRVARSVTTEQPAAGRRLEPRAPRRAPAPVPVRETPPPERRKGKARGILAVLAIVALIAVGVVIAVNQTQETPRIQDRSAVGNDVRDTVSWLESLIDDNTR
jgi:hypothetical protein